MKLSNFSRINCLVFILVSLSGCVNAVDQRQNYTTPQRTHPLANISHWSEREKTDLYEAIIAADLAFANGEYAMATSYYLAAAKLSGSTELVQLSAKSAKASNDGLGLLQAAEIWLAISPEDSQALALKITGLLFQQEIEQALNHTAKLLQQQKNTEKTSRLLEQIVQNQRPAVLNLYFQQLLLQYPQSEALHTASAAFFSSIAKQSRSPTMAIERAFTHINKALKLKPEFIPAIDLKTRLLYQTRQDEKAEAFLREKYAAFPNSKEISHLLGQLLYDLRKYDLTKQHYLTWLNQHPKDDEAQFFLAAAYFATSEYEKSLQSYRKILGSTYKPQASYFFCGNAASQLKKHDQAIACYDRVTQGKYFIRAKIELAKIYLVTQQIDQALATVRNPHLAKDEATQLQLINLEIEILNQHVSQEKAQKRLQTALKNYPNDAGLLFRKIKFEHLADKPKQLIPLLKNAEKQITNNKKKQLFNLSAANFLRNNNHYQAAVDWLNQALEQSPNDRDYWYARALYKEPLGLYDEMINDFKYLLALDPDNVNVKNALGYTLIDVNQEIEYAEQLIEQAFDAMPNNAAVIDSKGWLAYRKGLYQQAIKFLMVAYKMSPSADVATHLGEVYWKSGDKEKALQFWTQAKNIDPANYLLQTTIKKLGISLD